jgi:sporulation protein YlmC with PRC-barrel domain
MGKDVVDQEGNCVGTVKDVDLAIGKVSLVVEDKDGETRTICWDTVQGASDFIVLKPVQKTVSAAPEVAQPTQQSQSTPPCPICQEPLTWVPQYKRWYCYKDKKYA